MLVTDRDIRKLGLTKGLEAALQQRKIACCVYDETVPNPTIDNVEAARALYLANGAQAIIAFGGGSSMDCAKAAGARIVKPGQSVGQMKGLLHVHRRLPLLVAFPPPRERAARRRWRRSSPTARPITNTRSTTFPSFHMWPCWITR